MKKRIVTLLLAGAMTTALLAGCGNQGGSAAGNQSNPANGSASEENQAEENQQNEGNNQAAENVQNKNNGQQAASTQQENQSGNGASAITEEQAKEIALERAGISEGDTIAIVVKQDYDDGVSVYDVELYTADRDYEYEIGTADGTIYSQESEPVERISSTNVQTGVSLASAKSTLLAKVPGAAEENLRISLDRDDGVYYYEGEIIYNDRAYEFEMNAETGNLDEWSEELLNR